MKIGVPFFSFPSTASWSVKMGQFDPEQSVDANYSPSQSTNEKCDDAAVHIVGDTENVPIADSIAYPDGGIRAWATIAGA